MKNSHNQAARPVGCGATPHWYVKHCKFNGWFITNLRQRYGFGSSYLKKSRDSDLPIVSNCMGTDYFFRTRREARDFKRVWEHAYPAPPVEKKFFEENLKHANKK